MAEPIKIGNVSYIKTAKGWVDSKSKTPASAEVVKLLESISQKNPAPAQILPKAETETPRLTLKPSAASDDKTDQTLKSLTDNIKELSKGIEKLTKSISSNRGGAPSKPESSNKDTLSELIKPEAKVLTTGQAISQNIKDSFIGTKDRYGRVQDQGVVRRLTTAVSPFIAGSIFAGRDKKREGIAQQTEKFEKDLVAKNPDISKDDLNKAVQEKRALIEKSTTGKPGKFASNNDIAALNASFKPSAVNVSPAAQESADEKINKEQYGAKEDTQLLQINLIDIADNVVNKLADAITKALGEKASTKPDAEKQESTPADGGSNQNGSAFDIFKKNKTGGKLAGEAAKIGGLGRGAAAAEGAMAAEGVAAGGGLAAAAAPLALAGIVGVGGAAATHFATEKIKKSGHKKLGAAADIGGSAATGAATGALIGSVIPGVGTAAGAVAGGLVGGGIGLWNERDELFGKKPTPVMQKGPTLQTQALNQASKQNSMAKSQPGPTIVNGGSSHNPTNIVNNNGSGGHELPTAGKRGSLDIKTFA